MEYLAKIIREVKLGNSKLCRYDFEDIQTGQEDCFYNRGRIDCYIPNLVGKLNLSLEEDQQTKTCQSFEPDLVNTVKEFEKEKSLAKFVGKTNQTIKKLDNDFARKKRVEQLPHEIAELRKMGKSWEYIAKEFYHVSERTIRRWRKATYKPLQKEGRKEKISGIDLIFLLCYVLFGKKTITQQEVADYLYKERGIEVNQATICRILKKCGITYKRSTQRYLEKKPLLSKIIQFMKMVKDFPQELIGAIDECGFNFGGFPRHSYSRKGLRSIVWKMGKRGANHTLILYIQNVNGKGVICYQIIEGGMKAQNLYDFLKEVKFTDSRKHYLLLDNLKVHHTRKIKELLVSKNIEPIFLIPYTPELNPVELCFNLIRSYVEDCQPKNLEELKLAIDKAIEIIQKKDLTEYFRHCLNYDFSQKTSIRL